MFFRRKPPAPTVTVTNESFRRWLRASRPPWAWFLGLSELEQEQLAMIGDEHTQEVILAIGYAVSDPKLAEAGVEASRGKASGEETLVRRLAESFAQAIVGRESRNQSRMRDPARSPAEPPAPTFSGFGERKASAVANGTKRSGGLGIPGGATG